MSAQGRCFICERTVAHKPTPDERCDGCGARGSLRPVKGMVNVGMGPICGPSTSSAPIPSVPDRLQSLERALAEARKPRESKPRKPRQPAGRVAKVAESP